MGRIRTNFQKGTLGASLTNSGTTITFASAPGFATLAAGDYIPLVLGYDEADPEIVYLTAYTSAATSGTIARGKESTSGTARDNGDKWLHGVLAGDLPAAFFSRQFAADEPVAAPNAMDDEFTATLDTGSKWTTWVNQGSATADTTGGYLRMFIPDTGNTEGIRAICQATPAGNWKIRTKVHAPMFGTQYSGMGLVVMKTSSTDWRSVFLSDRIGGLQATTPTGVSSSFGTERTTNLPWLYVEAEWDGTIVTFRVSAQGDSFTDWSTWTPGATPSHVGIGFDRYGNPATHYRYAEWFRRVA